VEILGAILSHAGLNLAAEGQVRLARTAHEIHRLVHGGPEWVDLTERQQARWVAATGTVLERIQR
jgi:hypothetical protein